ncbi:MAG: SDR family oxidoreductase [Lacrimispora sp.]|uniref:SDR family NAD(P)-dependent oxidoreductase n=1 Tax=Lacrimispora sp. TaxID=2719234 RepID=UPI0039E26968
MFEVKNMNVLVTGGTRGIGLAIAKGFKNAGANVWIHGSKEESTRQVADENGFHCVYGNLTEVENVHKMMEQISKSVDVLDVLINNAGCEIHGTVDGIGEKELEDLFRVNLFSPAMFVKDSVELLKKSSYPSIINITSIHQLVAYKNNSAYCMSKAALEMHTKVSALELAEHGIRVNSIAPGAILTDINAEIIAAMDFEEWIPLNRVGNVEEIVGPAIFLASKAASYITGSTIFVDGGYKENLLRY